MPKDTEIIGHTMVPLSGVNECKAGECNLGNLVMDAMVYARVKIMSQNKNFKYYSDCSIAFTNSGGIRSSIDKKPDGAVMKSDVKLVLPFQGKFVIIEVSGGVIRKALQHSASEYGANNAAGGILHMSGVAVRYNLNKTKVEEKVASVVVICANCDVPQYEELMKSKKYKIIVPVYLYKGGGGYNFTEEGAEALPPVFYEFSEIDVFYVVDYLKDHQNIYHGLEGRIIFDYEEPDESKGSKMMGFSIVLHLLILKYII